ncbi:MAG: DUF427 domain-containing protein [Nitrospinota bacterium]
MAKGRNPLDATADSDHWIHIEKSPRRLRVVFGGETIADSKRVLLLREANRIPVYYFPMEDVRTDLLAESGQIADHPHRGIASFWTVKADEKDAERAIWSYSDPSPECAAVKGHVAFEWDKMDAWYEEDEEVFVHPRDPYKRVDVLRSSRHVGVVVAGETVAETRRPRLLFETGLPTRYYIPQEDVRADLLEPSMTTSSCPYKGDARYWSVKVGDKIVEDIVWSYPDPIPECTKIKGLLCFFNERVDATYVDGDRLPAPKTPWS